MGKDNYIVNTRCSFLEIEMQLNLERNFSFGRFDSSDPNKIDGCPKKLKFSISSI